MVANGRCDRECSPRKLYRLTLIYLGALLLSAWIYMLVQRTWPDIYEHLFDDPSHLLGIGWFGSLGGIIANVTGLARHRRKWNVDWNFWYGARPLTSGVVAVIGYLIYISLVQASLATNSERHVAPTVLGYAIAFAIGFREDVFRDLLQRVFELIAGAGGADTQPPSAPPNFRGRLSADGSHATLSWGHATDNVAVVAYNLYRDDRLLATIRISPPPSERSDERVEFIDYLTAADQGCTYAVTAADAAGNESSMSGPITVRVPESESGRPEAGVSSV